MTRAQIQWTLVAGILAIIVVVLVIVAITGGKIPRTHEDFVRIANETVRVWDVLTDAEGKRMVEQKRADFVDTSGRLIDAYDSCLDPENTQTDCICRFHYQDKKGFGGYLVSLDQFGGHLALQRLMEGKDDLLVQIEPPVKISTHLCLLLDPRTFVPQRSTAHISLLPTTVHDIPSAQLFFKKEGQIYVRPPGPEDDAVPVYPFLYKFSAPDPRICFVALGAWPYPSRSPYPSRRTEEDILKTIYYGGDVSPEKLFQQAADFTIHGRNLKAFTLCEEKKAEQCVIEELYWSNGNSLDTMILLDYTGIRRYVPTIDSSDSDRTRSLVVRGKGCDGQTLEVNLFRYDVATSSVEEVPLQTDSSPFASGMASVEHSFPRDSVAPSLPSGFRTYGAFVYYFRIGIEPGPFIILPYTLEEIVHQPPRIMENRIYVGKGKVY